MHKNHNLSEIEISKILEKYHRIECVLKDCCKLVDKTSIQQYWNSNNPVCSASERSDNILRLDVEFYEKMISKCFRLYNEVNKYVSNHSFSDIRKIQRQSFHNNEIFAFRYINDRLYVQLPRFVKRLKSKQGGMIFENEFRAKIADFFQSLSEQISFKEKMLYIINAYPSNVNPLLVPDNDNLDFKRAIDIITDFVGGGDSAFNCSYMITSVCSDAIPEGAYIILQNGKASMLNKVEIIRLLTTDFVPEIVEK